MRCYLMKDGHIFAVEFLEEDTDSRLVEKAGEVFERRRPVANYDGFEVWDGSRFIYRWPPAVPQGPPADMEL